MSKKNKLNNTLPIEEEDNIWTLNETSEEEDHTLDQPTEEKDKFKSVTFLNSYGDEDIIDSYENFENFKIKNTVVDDSNATVSNGQNKKLYKHIPDLTYYLIPIEDKILTDNQNVINRYKTDWYSMNYNEELAISLCFIYSLDGKTYHVVFYISCHHDIYEKIIYLNNSPEMDLRKNCFNMYISSLLGRKVKTSVKSYWVGEEKIIIDTTQKKVWFPTSELAYYDLDLSFFLYITQNDIFKIEETIMVEWENDYYVFECHMRGAEKYYNKYQDVLKRILYFNILKLNNNIECDGVLRLIETDKDKIKDSKNKKIFQIFVNLLK